MHRPNQVRDATCSWAGYSTQSDRFTCEPPHWVCSPARRHWSWESHASSGHPSASWWLVKALPCLSGPSLCLGCHPLAVTWINPTVKAGSLILNALRWWLRLSPLTLLKTFHFAAVHNLISTWFPGSSFLLIHVKRLFSELAARPSFEYTGKAEYNLSSGSSAFV